MRSPIVVWPTSQMRRKTETTVTPSPWSRRSRRTGPLFHVPARCPRLPPLRSERASQLGLPELEERVLLPADLDERQPVETGIGERPHRLDVRLNRRGLSGAPQPARCQGGFGFSCGYHGWRNGSPGESCNDRPGVSGTVGRVGGREAYTMSSP